MPTGLLHYDRAIVEDDLTHNEFPFDNTHFTGKADPLGLPVKVVYEIEDEEVVSIRLKKEVGCE